jgi:intraflagellar transport protein 172
MESKKSIHKVTSICYSNDNCKIAVVTSDRIVYMFDENGEQRDRFSTKAAVLVV